MKENIFGNQNYNAALYMRLSKDDGDKEESESITNQRKILRTYAEENDYNIYDEYIDDGYSGTNFNRPSFKKMIKDIDTGKINMVITKNLARLGRDYIETGRYIETYFPENEIRYIAILDDVDTYLDKNCDTVAFKNIMNDFYAKETSKNIKKTKNRKKREGFYYTSYAPFGYKKIDKTGKLEIDEVSAETVRRIYKEFLNGKGTYQIAKLLNKEGVITPGLYMSMTTNNIWRHTTIKRILTNPIYIGNVVQNKRKKISYKSKKMITLPEKEYIVTKNHHPEIIKKETWNIVQKMLENHDGEKIKEKEPILKPLLYCSHCNNKLQVIIKNDKYKEKTTKRRYITTNQTCYKQYINYDKLEKEILKTISEEFKKNLISDNFKKENLLENFKKSKSQKEELEEKIEQINRKLKNVNKKVSMLYSDKLNELIEEQDYCDFSENLINERHKLEELKRKTILEIEKNDINYDDKEIEEKMKNIIKNLVYKGEFNKEDLQQLINKIEIDKDKNVLIQFNFSES